jgi:methylenetetrahydrofolate dehydrogenase (NADP+)/methenyltetrahydrofolate cyclohydrolase
VPLDGAHVVIVGRNNIVRSPRQHAHRKSPTGNATVTVYHPRTKDLARYTQQADIVARGAARTITADMVRDGVVVIDVSVNRVRRDEESRFPARRRC